MLVCKNVAESDHGIRFYSSRDHTVCLVVENPLDVIAFERSGRYKGLYHVLHGAINPLENIGPEEIFIQQLIDRVNNEELIIKEIIIATNPTMEAGNRYVFDKTT